jgi:hypothetical protein
MAGQQRIKQAILEEDKVCPSMGRHPGDHLLEGVIPNRDQHRLAPVLL